MANTPFIEVNLTSALNEVEELFNDDFIPIENVGVLISGTRHDQSQYRLSCLWMGHQQYRICLSKGPMVIAMYQDSEPELIQYCSGDYITYRYVELQATEEQLFQESLVDATVCTIGDLQAMIRIFQEGIDSMAEWYNEPKRVLKC